MICGSLEEIARANNPVLLPDTCIILDLVRSPRRDNVDGHAMLAGKAIREAVHASGEISCVIAEQVRLELTDNLPAVREETERALRRLSEEIKRIDEWSAALDHASQTNVTHFLSRVPVAETLIADIVASSLDFATSDEITGRAHVRVMQKRTPAKLGKDSWKDCVVIESYLEVARQLRAVGHTADIVFASSNTDEFVSGIPKALNWDIANEFSHLGIVYARALHETRHRLGLSPNQTA